MPSAADSLCQRIVHAMPWAVLVLGHDGLLRLANPQAAELLGRASEALQGQPLAQALPADFPDALRQDLLAALSGAEPVRGEYYLPHAGRWIEMTTVSGPDEVLVYWQDVSLRVQQHQQYRALADHTPDAVVRWGPDLRLLYGNPAMAAEASRPLAELLGCTMAEMGAPLEQSEPYMAKLRRVFATGQPEEHYGQYTMPKGTVFFHSLLVPEVHNGQVQSVLALAHNVTELKRVEAELRTSRDLLAAIFDSSSLAIQMLRNVRNEAGDIVDFDFVLTNAAADAMAGRRVAGTRCLVDWPHTVASGLFEHYASVARTGQPLDFEDCYRGDGVDSWFRYTVVPFHDGLLVTVEDIGGRKKADLALQEAHAQLNALFEAVPVQLGYFHAVRDGAGQLVDLRSAAVNQSLTQAIATPVPVHELVSAQLPGLREMPVWEIMRAVIETGRPQRLEVYHNFGQGGRWFDVQYTRLDDGLISASLDITARKQLEQSLREGQELLHTVFNASLASFEVMKGVRDAKGQLVDFEWVLTNDAAQRLLQRHDVVGRRLLEEEPGMGPSGVFERLRQAAEQQQPVDFEVPYPHNGTEAWFHVAAAPLGDGLVVTWQDITARQQATAELLRLQLVQQQQLANAVLEAQETERRRIAESLHNGLGQLLYAAQLRLDQLSIAAGPAAFADGKRQTVQLLKTAIQQTRSLSHQLIPTILEDFGLVASVRDICQRFSTPGGPHFICVAGSFPEVPPALGLALFRMAQELANNIVRHANATEASLQLAERDGFLLLQAADNGRGFDPDLPRPNSSGLKALRDRVRLLDGRLAIVSAPGHGTQVSIRIPSTALSGSTK
ncbi:PAS domain-containing protein [Hymenobacter sp. BT523]|uniref:sensor histidine kinase n=1 Tax=Hymenobacter sp. BT523 TaxID=2795725 RepID=UPI0018EA6455|nr:PAS domain-containing protein [Hymenobacter sp. BT523]MBJ6110719.1 PAS domain-containing protein [Hymenobacter sp. BT523]